MEYANGCDLGDVIGASYRAIPRRIAVHIIREVCKDLFRGESHGHRGLSPHDVHILGTGEVRITEFPGTGATEPNVGYLSPEELQGRHLDHRSDVFSAGILLYELLLGRPCFIGASMRDMLEAICNADVVPLVELIPGFPNELDQIVLKALSRKKTDRFQDGLAFEGALAEWANQPGAAVHAAELAVFIYDLQTVPSEARWVVGASIGYDARSSNTSLGFEVVDGTVLWTTPVALVRLAGKTVSDEKQIARLRLETEIATNLQHPNILRVVGLERLFDEWDEGAWVRIVNFANGEPLTSILSSSAFLSPLGPRFAARVIVDLCEAVGYAHSLYPGNPIVHGGIRPGTLIVSFSGSTLVTGYGASALGAHASTPQEAASTATDIQAIGAVLYELLVGASPFGSGEDLEQAIIAPVSGLFGRLGAVASGALAEQFATSELMQEAIVQALEAEALPTPSELAMFISELSSASAMACTLSSELLTERHSLKFLFPESPVLELGNLEEVMISQFDEETPLCSITIEVTNKEHDIVFEESFFDRDVIKIGRLPSAHVRLSDDPRVSRIHAVIERVSGVYHVVDLGSAEGTYVHRKRISKHSLNTGDRIQVGEHTITVVLPARGLPGRQNPSLAQSDAVTPLGEAPSGALERLLEGAPSPGAAVGAEPNTALQAQLLALPKEALRTLLLALPKEAHGLQLEARAEAALLEKEPPAMAETRESFWARVRARWDRRPELSRREKDPATSHVGVSLFSQPGCDPSRGDDVVSEPSHMEALRDLFKKEPKNKRTLDQYTYSQSLEEVSYIGEGASAHVRRAIDERYDRLIALKVFEKGRATVMRRVSKEDEWRKWSDPGLDLATTSRLEQYRASRTALARFDKRIEREAKALMSINHPNVMRCLGFALPTESIDHPYIAMEYIGGISLWELMLQYGRLGPTVAIGLVKQILFAVDAISSKKLVHRDIKPENVMLTWDTGFSPLVRVVDFGLVTFLGDSNSEFDESPTQLTQVNDLPGTRGYRSIEALAGASPSVLFDLYSVGVILYELLTNQKPYGRVRGGEIDEATRTRQFVKIGPGELLVPDTEEAKSMTKPLIELVHDCVGSTPKRPKTVSDFITRLDKAWPW